MNLYPYQKKIFDSSIEHLKKNNNLMIVIPTGGGKTVVFSHIIKHLNLKTLIIAHTKELVDQARKTLKIIGVKKADVMTIQRAYKYPEIANEYEMLIIDECHRAASPSYLKLIENFKNKKLIGVTATPFRSDGQWLFDIFGTKISPLSLVEMIEEGLLCDFEAYRIKTDCSLTGISTKNGDFISSRLAPVINVKNRNELIVKEYKNICFNEKALCFAVNIAHADELAKEFKKNGIPCESIHGELSRLDREKYIKDFKDGKIKVIISCKILTEGFDEPSITALLMARPTLSKVLYMQMIGRGSRIFPGKNVCKVLEFTDNNYDVSSLEELIFANHKTHSMCRGERLSEYKKRTLNLLDETKETIIEKYKMLAPTSYSQEKATDWQIKFLKMANVEIIENISKVKADELIRKISNG